MFCKTEPSKPKVIELPVCNDSHLHQQIRKENFIYPFKSNNRTNTSAYMFGWRCPGRTGLADGHLHPLFFLKL